MLTDVTLVVVALYSHAGAAMISCLMDQSMKRNLVSQFFFFFLITESFGRFGVLVCDL